MKIKFRILFIMCIVINGSSLAQKTFEISQIEIKYPALDKAIRDYIVDADLVDFGVVLLKYDPTNGVYYISYEMYKNFVKLYPPSFFAIVDRKVVLIYTGFENQIKYDDRSFGKLFKVAAKVLVVPPMEVTYNAPVWRVLVINGYYTKENLDSIPLGY